MVRFLYNLIVVPLVLAIAIAVSAFNKKVYRSIKARKGLFAKLQRQKMRLNPYKKTILFHCASMGEYKQALPLIKAFRAEEYRYNIILSLFSPSVVDNLTSAPRLEVVTYLPFDTPFAMNKFVEACNPDIVIISKHDVWPNFLHELSRRDIPVFLVNALFATDSAMNRWYARPFFKAFYKKITGIITVNQENKDRFTSIYPFPDQIYTSGDSRFDTVLCEAESAKDSELYHLLKLSERVLVAGSTWPAGERIVLSAWREIKDKFEDAFLVIVPHEIEVDHIYKIETFCQENDLSYLVYSDYDEKENLKDYDVLIVDAIGLLTTIYSAASIAYVGGGFGKDGLHSVLEPAAYGIPVLFGHNLHKSPEARDMHDLGCGIVFYNDREMVEIVSNLWNDADRYQKLCSLTTTFVKMHAGATERIVEILSKKLGTQNKKFNDSFTDDELKKLIDNEK